MTLDKGSISATEFSAVQDCFGDIQQIIAQSRQTAYAAVNAVMIEAYWKIGQRIVEEDQHGSRRAEYGKALINTLA